MNRIWKKVSVLLLALCMIVGASTLIACKKDAGETVSYTVTVMQDAATPANGVQVTVQKGTAKFDTKKTGADGKVTFDLAEDEYSVVLGSLPAGYEIPADAGLTLSAANRNITVTLAEKFHYTVKLVMEDGSPLPAVFANASVMICTISDDPNDLGTCRTPVALDMTTASARIYEKKDSYHVKIIDENNNIPNGYTYDHDANDYYSGETFDKNSDVTEMTITIRPV